MKCASTAHKWCYALRFLFAKANASWERSECIMPQSGTSLQSKENCAIINKKAVIE